MVVLFTAIYPCCSSYLDLVCAGCRDPEAGKILKKLFQADYFRIVVVEDATTVELCGALKVGTS